MSGSTEAKGLLKIRFIQNTFISGPQAWFFLVADNGHFEREGLEVKFTLGHSLARTVSTLSTGGYDAGYGDLNELVRLKAEGAESTPMAVLAIQNRPPYTIAVRSDGDIKMSLDLAGKRLVSHPQDAALLLFPEFCRATGLAPDSVSITILDLTHVELSRQMMAGEWDGIFGFVNTVNSQAIEAGIDPSTAFHHLTWFEQIPGLYGGAMMVMPEFLAAHPEAVGGFVRAVNAGLKDTIDDGDAAIDALARMDSGIEKVANKERLMGMLALEMNHSEAMEFGIGDADDRRFQEVAELIVSTKGYAGPPQLLSDVFNRDFLPPVAERARVTGAQE